MSTLHQSCIGDEVTDLLEAVDVVDLVEDHQGEDFTHAGDTSKQVYGHGIMFRNLCYDLSFDSEDLLVKGVHECGIRLDTGTNHRVCEAICYTYTIGPAVYALIRKRAGCTECWCSGCVSEAVHADEQGTTGGEGDHVLSALAVDTHRP